MRFRLGGSVLAALLVAPAPAAALAPNGPIAFAGLHHGVHDVFAIDPDGSHLRNLTRHPAADDDPAFSPDGLEVAFDRRRDPGSADIWVMRADGTGQTRLTATPGSDDVEPAFSPDGSKIAFASNREGPTRIFVMHSDGTHVRRLTGTIAFDRSPSFSADGSKIVFRRARAESEVFVMNADGTGQTDLTNEPGFDGAPTFSPADRTIAFDSSRAGNSDVYVMNTDGSQPTRLTGIESAGGSHPAFSPDGTRIVFQFVPRGLGLMNADGTGMTGLASGTLQPVRPTWGPIPSRPQVCPRGTSPTVRCTRDSRGRLTMTGTRRDETLVGGTRSDRIRGEAGDDTIRGRGGNDRIFGGSGDDRLSGGPGHDRLSCGRGRDRARRSGHDRVSRSCELR